MNTDGTKDQGESYNRDVRSEIAELFWQFHNDRLDNPNLTEMKPYIQPILDLLDRVRISELEKLHDLFSSNTYVYENWDEKITDRISKLRTHPNRAINEHKDGKP